MSGWRAVVIGLAASTLSLSVTRQIVEVARPPTGRTTLEPWTILAR